MINNNPKNNVILIAPRRNNTTQSYPLGKLGLMANKIKPAGKARTAPNNSGGHPSSVY